MKEYLKEGDFARTKMENSNLLIGGLLMVDDVEGMQVYVHHVPKNSIGSFCRLRSRLKKLSCIKLQMSVEDLEHLIRNRPNTLTRKLTTRWEAAIGKQYDVAVFYNPHVDISIVVTEPRFWNPFKISTIRPQAKQVAVRWTNLYAL